MPPMRWPLRRTGKGRSNLACKRVPTIAEHASAPGTAEAPAPQNGSPWLSSRKGPAEAQRRYPFILRWSHALSFPRFCASSPCSAQRIRARSMKATTWEAIDSRHSEFPDSRASGVSDAEISEASARLGIAFPSDYSDFLRRCGGGHLGSYAIAGLRRWEFAADEEWSVVARTKFFRQQRYPGTERWVVFTDDGFANPIGFDAEGRVWLSDHHSTEFVGLELSFEAWLRRHALELDEPSSGYFAHEQWPQAILDELRANRSPR